MPAWVDITQLVVLTLTLVFIIRYVIDTNKLAKAAQEQVKLTRESINLAKGIKENPFEFIDVVKSDDGNILFSVRAEINITRILSIRKLSQPAGNLEFVPGINQPIMKGHTFTFTLPKKLASKLPYKFQITFRHGDLLKNRIVEYEYDGNEFWLKI